MDAWKNPDDTGINIYTNKSESWAPALNATTAELKLGHLPSNVRAIPGLLADGDYADINDTTIVIQNASRTKFGDRNIERIVFGASSGAAILILLVVMLWKYKPIMKKKTHLWGPVQAADTEDDMDQFTSDSKFRQELAKFYGQAETLPEMTVKKVSRNDITKDDVEDLNEKVRKLLELDIRIYSMRDNTDMNPDHVRRLKLQSDAMLEEIRQVIGDWQSQSRRLTAWNTEEARIFYREILPLFQSRLGRNPPVPQYRYPEAHEQQPVAEFEYLDTGFDEGYRGDQARHSQARDPRDY